MFHLIFLFLHNYCIYWIVELTWKRIPLYSLDPPYPVATNTFTLSNKNILICMSVRYYNTVTIDISIS